MNIKKTIYIILGSIFFMLGIVGYYMPLMPGTIFMIISAYFFMSSSKKLYNKIINNSLYGNPVKQYIENGIIPFKTKIIILLSMWITVLITIYITPSMQFPLKLENLNINFIINLKILAIGLTAIGTMVVLKAKNK
tara:strand:- start:526 stop:933 length:408 start_codon:yes stop_codon:yes gene_type:complete